MFLLRKPSATSEYIARSLGTPRRPCSLLLIVSFFLLRSFTFTHAKSGQLGALVSRYVDVMLLVLYLVFALQVVKSQSIIGSTIGSEIIRRDNPKPISVPPSQQW